MPGLDIEECKRVFLQCDVPHSNNPEFVILMLNKPVPCWVGDSGVPAHLSAIRGDANAWAKFFERD